MDPPTERRRDGERRRTAQPDHGAPHARAVTLHSFGGLAVSLSGRPPQSVPGARQRQLLRWLMLGPWGAPLNVDTVCDALWPAADGAAAASNFSSTVRRLRLTLGDPGTIVVEAGTVALHGAHCCTDFDILRRLADTLTSVVDPDHAALIARQLLLDFDGANAVLLAPPAHDDMAQRILAVGISWRQVTLQLAQILRGSAHVSLALRLCERIERHGLADARVLARWQDLARDTWQG